MRLTSFTDYSLRVLMYLALEPDRLATIPEIARAYAISENHLMKVVHQLAKSGVVESRARQGGRHPPGRGRPARFVSARWSGSPKATRLSSNAWAGNRNAIWRQPAS